MLKNISAQFSPSLCLLILCSCITWCSWCHSPRTPLNIKQCTAIKSRKQPAVLKALGKHFSVFQRYNKSIEIILSDGEGAVVTMENKVSAIHAKLDSFQLNIEAAGSHVPYVENLISFVKAKVRGFTSTSLLEEVPKAESHVRYDGYDRMCSC